jgi:Helix-turn-helix domain
MGWTRWEGQRIEQLVAEGAPPWMLFQAVPHSRHAVRRFVLRLKRVPKPEPARSPLRLSLSEREEISRGVAGGESLRSIAARLSRAPSTISREVRCNGGRRRYRALAADRRAVREMRRPKPAKLTECARLRRVVESKLEQRWSPQQISGWLECEFPTDPEMRVARDDLCVVVCAVAQRAAQRTDSLSSPRSWQPTTAWAACVERARSARRHDQYSPTARRRKRQSGARPLGGRPAHGQTHARDGNAGRTQDPLRHAGRIARWASCRSGR